MFVVKVKKKKRFIFVLFSYVYVCLPVCARECRCPRRIEALDLLELELQMVMNHLTWVLRTEL